MKLSALLNEFRFSGALLFLTLLFVSCRQNENTDARIHQKEIEKWRAERISELKKENGWLTLCGLFWLREGENKLGTDSSNAVIFPRGKSPGYAGSIFLNNGELRFRRAGDVPVLLDGSAAEEMIIRSDESGKASPTVMTLGPLNFNAIRRGEKLGIRIRDNENRARTEFKGLEYFPVDLKFRIEATFERYNPPKSIPIENVLNQIKNEDSPGCLSFKIGGKDYRLDVLNDKEMFFIIFRDETAGEETYGMGRFLTASFPDSTNKVTVDFNKAYNPPCAFTEFATCPLPPKQNYLPVRIEAGEKKYTHHNLH